MPFILELPHDIGAKLGARQVSLDCAQCRVALRTLANDNPKIHDLLINSKDELRQTIRCSLNGEILDDQLLIPDGAQVKLFFVRAGG